jgi:hypothetical protein
MNTAMRSVMPLLAASMLLLPATASAQTAPNQYIAINPLGVIFRIYSGEFERRVNPAWSLGLSSTYWGGEFGDFDTSADVSYLSVDAKARYYPAGRAFEGFGFGGLVGLTTLSGELRDEEGRTRDRGNAVSIGVVLDYNWLLGANNRFLVGLGVGAKRLYALDVEEADITVAYPTARLSICYAF